ncbi:hypothetical protein G7Y89_g2491 [Cudoniella acicularis]|uniref:Serine hydrolase domain-containing protein n=1 Tax=Cudoniella acicularis TaxID=354080 RepID=A0A8H4RW75_9HELO|nr:hypothetical protein G7Y89_g2491 [Cudoniella acicularis]
MTFNITGTGTRPSLALLCFHGTGSSAAIFRIQLSKLRLALKNHFEFIFVDAPIECGPGPGVLPLFARAGPFYSWFGIDNPTIESALPGIYQRLSEAVQDWEASKTHPESRIVGLLSFSEGTLVSSLLLW